MPLHESMAMCQEVCGRRSEENQLRPRLVKEFFLPSSFDETMDFRVFPDTLLCGIVDRPSQMLENGSKIENERLL